MARPIQPKRPRRGSRSVPTSHEESVVVNKIDAQKILAPINKAIKQVNKSVDLNDERSIRKARSHKRALKALGWDLWLENELIAAQENNEIDSVLLSHLKAAEMLEEEKDKKTTIELTGEGGGPLEMVQRMSSKDLEMLEPFRKMLMNDQKRRLLPVTGTDKTA